MSSLRLLRQPIYCRLSHTAIRLPPPQITLRSRAFHATARREDAALLLLSLPHGVLTTLHEVVPWYAAIPASAFLVRGLLLWAIGLKSRGVTVRYVGTHPLRQALTYHKIRAARDGREIDDAKQFMKQTRAAARRELAELDRRWNCSLKSQFAWSLSPLPVYLIMSEVIRRMGGMRDGIMGMMLTGMGLKNPDTSLHGVGLGTNKWYEPTLADEGMLWFPNLLEPDPLGYLPFLVSALMLANFAFRGGRMQLRPGGETSLQKGLRRGMILLSLTIGPICQDVPAALMLYWTASTSSIILANWWLDVKHPVPTGLTKCERPLQALYPKSASKLPRKSVVRK